MSRSSCSPHKAARTLPVCLCVCSGMWSFWMSRNVYTKGCALRFTWEPNMMFLYRWFLQPAGNLIISAQASAANRNAHRHSHIHTARTHTAGLSECHSPPPVCHGSYYSAVQNCQHSVWEDSSRSWIGESSSASFQHTGTSSGFFFFFLNSLRFYNDVLFSLFFNYLLCFISKVNYKPGLTDSKTTTHGKEKTKGFITKVWTQIITG